MTEKFIEFPATKLPDPLRGWVTMRVGGVIAIVGGTGEALAVLPGAAEDDVPSTLIAEQQATAMVNAPEMLLLIETVIEQAKAGQKIDLGYLMAMSERIRRAGQP